MRRKRRVCQKLSCARTPPPPRFVPLLSSTVRLSLSYSRTICAKKQAYQGFSASNRGVSRNYSGVASFTNTTDKFSIFLLRACFADAIAFSNREKLVVCLHARWFYFYSIFFLWCRCRLTTDSRWPKKLSENNDWSLGPLGVVFAYCWIII